MFPKIYINKFIFSDEVQFGFSEATASSSHLQILPLLCVIEESPSLKMYGHKLWQSPAIGRAGRANFGSLDQTGSKTLILTVLTLSLLALSIEIISALHCSALKLTVLSYKRPFEPHGNYLSNDHLIIENIYSS